MTNSKMNRRDMMRMALLGGVGAGLFKYDPNVVLNPSHYTSVDALANLMKGLQGGPEQDRLFGALAQNAVNDVVFVHVKFYMGMNSNYLMKVGNNSILNKASQATATYLRGVGFDDVADRPKHSAARLNKYFSNMLHYGTMDGMPRGTTNIVANTAAEIAASDSEADSLLADYQVYGGTGLGGIGQHNQQTFNINFDSSPTARGQGCINYFLEMSGILRSPLGIVALGTRNRIIANEGGTAANGATITEFNNAMSSLVADGYVKKSQEGNLASIFDQKALRAESAKGVRDNIRASIQDLKSKVSQFGAASAFQTQTWAPIGVTSAGRTSETIGYFVLAGRAAATGLFNNFAIGVNTIDLNGQNIDVAGAGTLNALDAIQQTAIGLHMLIKKLKEQGKSYVIEVESELSRNLNMGDSGVLSAMTIVGGPKFRSAYRSDFLAPMTLGDTNATAAGFRAGALLDANGRPQGESSVVKDQYRLGVAQIIAEATGKTDKVKEVGRPRIAFTKA